MHGQPGGTGRGGDEVPDKPFQTLCGGEGPDDPAATSHGAITTNTATNFMAPGTTAGPVFNTNGSPATGAAASAGTGLVHKVFSATRLFCYYSELNKAYKTKWSDITKYHEVISMVCYTWILPFLLCLAALTLNSVLISDFRLQFEPGREEIIFCFSFPHLQDFLSLKNKIPLFRKPPRRNLLPICNTCDPPTEAQSMVQVIWQPPQKCS